MTQYQRITGKVFGGNATATGNDPQIAQFGSALANTFVGTTDPETIQSLPAWGQGWIGAVTPETQFPPLPEMTGAMKVLSHQICGILQQGVSTWDSGTIYYTGNFVSQNGRLYISQVDENQGNNPATDTTNWQEFSSGGGLEIGDVAFTQMAIDESKGKRRKLNGQIIIQEQYQQLTNILKASIAQNPDMACTEQEWQAEVTMSTTGTCYKFVVDDVGGTIRLPKYPEYFITGLVGNIAVVGNGNTLGMTSNGTQSALLFQNSASGAYLTSDTTALGKPVGTNYGSFQNVVFNTPVGVTTDPTKSGLIAQLNNAETEKIKGTYFIQVATGSETEDNIVNSLELNNPFVLLEPKYFEAEVYNVSWLLANGSYNGSSAVHPSAYQALLVENNAEVAIGSTVTLPIGTEYTKRGLSVKLSTDSDITDYDFVVNTSDETFRLPIKVNLASGKAVVGNGMTLGLTDGTNNYGLAVQGSGYTGQMIQPTLYGQSIGTNSPTTTQNINKSIGITTDSTKSGIELSDQNLYLYFYVGETVQNANLINAGRIEEKLASLIPDNSELISSYGMPSNKYIDLTLGATGTTYTAPANGWFYLSKQANTEGKFAIITKTGVGEYSVETPYVGQYKQARMLMPVRKNDVVKVEYNLDGPTYYFMFFYAQGAESEAE